MIDANLIKVMEQFGSEDKCRDYLETLRWPEGVTCPRCKCASVSQIVKRSQYDCNDCRYQFSVKAGTIFNDSHLPLTKWFIVTYLITESRKGMSANQIKRMIGGSYKTAWYLCHRIRAAMAEAEKPMLSGTVEMDETFIGGWSTLEMRRKSKEVVIGIRERGGDLRFFHAEDVKSGTLAKYIKENISADVEVVMTDEWTGYPKAMIEAGISGRKHKTIKHSDKVYVDGDIHTNTAESAFSLLKRGIVGTWHKISAKHLQAYLEEMTFRFNRRKSPYLFQDTLRHMVTASTLTFEALTSEDASAA
jgi:transposase-like protein